MFISKITVPARTILVHRASDLYGLHRFLWKIFSDGPERTRDFLFHSSRKEGQVECLVVSARQPVNSIPDVTIETKPYSPILREGQIFEFTLEVNPVVRSTKDKKKHDVVMHWKKSKKEGADSPQPAVMEWLLKRQELWGCTIQESSILVDAYEQVQINKGQKRVSFSLCRIRGYLKIDDAEAFKKILFSGIGSAKAFGCGLMLIRSPRYVAAA